jgi:ketosteroid isomerase-like protein
MLMNDEHEIHALIERWAKAVRNEDRPAIRADHDPGILMFDVPPPFSSQVLHAYMATWETLFSSAEKPVAFDFHDVRVTCGQDVAFASAVGRCVNIDATGKREPLKFRLDGAPYGGARYPVESIMGGRTFVKFHLDVGVGDVVLDPPEHARMRDWLGFAGIAVPDVPMIQREQQFAEKLHAYTLPRTTPNSRVRDLVDMVLLIQSGTLEQSRVVQALNATFGRRATHSFPAALTPPQEEWRSPFVRLAAECSLELSVSEAFSIVMEFCAGL